MKPLNQPVVNDSHCHVNFNVFENDFDASEFEESESVTLRPKEKHLSGLRSVIQKSVPGPG